MFISDGWTKTSTAFAMEPKIVSLPAIPHVLFPSLTNLIIDLRLDESGAKQRHGLLKLISGSEYAYVVQCKWSESVSDPDQRSTW